MNPITNESAQSRESVCDSCGQKIATNETLRQALIRFTTGELPQLGSPWMVSLFVDKLLALLSTYRISRDRLSPGQTIWPAIAINDRSGDRKPVSATHQVPVIITVTGQEQITDLRAKVQHTQILKRALVRAANDAFAQGGVLSTTDLAALFHRGHSRIAELICQYEEETGNIVPRRDNIQDIERTVNCRRTICRKAYLEYKPSHVIAQETRHSPQAVDHYVLDFARVYIATVEQGLTIEQTSFLIQRPLSTVRRYTEMIEEFALDKSRVHLRSGVDMHLGATQTESVANN